MIRLIDTSKLKTEYDRDSYDINKAAQHIADKTKKKCEKEKKQLIFADPVFDP